MPGDEGYDGATRITNNTAEVTALLRAVQEETLINDGKAVEFCVERATARSATSRTASM